MQPRVRKGAMIAGLSGIALVVIMVVFDWYSIPDVEGGGLDAFASYGDIFNLLLLAAAIAGIGLLMLDSAGAGAGLPVSLSAIATGLGGLAALWVLIKLFATPELGDDEFGTVDTDIAIGAVLGLITAAGVAVGGWLAMQDEGAGAAAQSPPPSAPPPGPGPAA